MQSTVYVKCRSPRCCGCWASRISPMLRLRVSPHSSTIFVFTLHVLQNLSHGGIVGLGRSSTIHRGLAIPRHPSGMIASSPRLSQSSHVLLVRRSGRSVVSFTDPARKTTEATYPAPFSEVSLANRPRRTIFQHRLSGHRNNNHRRIYEPLAIRAKYLA